ncbi:type IV pilus twitching motility protein PilT [Blautia sp. An46]|uniref:PilT/PilU family type 4a pilus ATPase n=1 Tax=Candidatus Blautia merdigallinarum TaxID=2838495 RepID=A0A9D2SKK9_9FIRM|nr:PilT/PilU family type 4a pilus ATPase [Blautia sp. An46]OUN94554.1 type IV pili twitching motility protein PilT [Blautia sp. An46]HJC10649.1 PilT/PilU family type 4a pilus ATPase [Candidatus Blautia merdigallinarum]
MSETIKKDTQEILQEISLLKASDIFVVAGRPLSYRLNNQIREYSGEKLMPEDTMRIIQDIYALASHRSISPLTDQGDDDFSFALPGVSRFRVNTYMQRGSAAAVIRIISFTLPSPQELGIPEGIIRLGELNKGMVLVTGTAGSGKSTTLACIIDYINKNREKHIITLEDPLEYLHRHEKSIVSQREITTDTVSYISALRASLRQSPDVILLGEMRDYETMQVAMTAAETGHLIFSSLHTTGAANTIDRIIDVFPANQQKQISVQLSMVLQCIISQQLVPAADGGRIPVFEIMTMNPALRNMIRERKIPQIEGQIYNSASDTMCSMDSSLLKLFRSGRITRQTALDYAANPEMLMRNLGR